MSGTEVKKLRSLRARAIALQATLADLRKERDDGMVDTARYARLSTTLDAQRIEILDELRTTLAVKDPEFDRILQQAFDLRLDDDAGGAELGQALLGLAERKGIGAEVRDQIEKRRGNIISWIIDAGIALGTRLIT
jgi:hypothetical protein